MAEVEVPPTCSNPGCDQPGTNKCSACKTTFYCCVICQTADWVHHKEECQGHLRKVGMTNLAKATGFHQQQNWVQTLRYSELAATKLKQLKDRRLETVQAISDALTWKHDALERLDRQRDALECIKECYTLWAMNHIRNPGSIRAALGLIQSCVHNHEYEDAKRLADHAMFMINDRTDNLIPPEQRPEFLADASYWLAVAINRLAEVGGFPSHELQKSGEEAISLARQALEMHTQLYGAGNISVASDMRVLGDVLSFFRAEVDDNEVPRLYEQAIAITIHDEGSMSVNVGVCEKNWGVAYQRRAHQAEDANDLDRCITYLDLTLTHFREAERNYRYNTLPRREASCVCFSNYNIPKKVHNPFMVPHRLYLCYEQQSHGQDQCYSSCHGPSRGALDAGKSKAGNIICSYRINSNGSSILGVESYLFVYFCWG